MAAEDIDSTVLGFPAGSEIIREGTEEKSLYVLLEGKCAVYKKNVLISSFSEKGTYFGEMGLILGVPRNATVKATTDVKVVKMDIDLDTMLTKYPDMTKKILNTLARRVIKQTNALYAVLATVDVGDIAEEE